MQFDTQHNEIESDDYAEKSLKEKIQQNQSYCFQSIWAHSGTIYCLNVGGSTVYQHDRAIEH